VNLRVLVVDDEPLARARLRTLLSACDDPAAAVAGEAASATQALAILGAGGVDLVLLDIHMPGMNGLHLAQSLRSLDHAPGVVFVTAHAEHALTAFDLDVVDYLTKPVRQERLQAALRKALRRQAGEGGDSPAGSEVSSLVIQGRTRTERVPLADVLVLKAELKYVTVRTAVASHLYDGSLAELEARFPDHFLRVHRNALVARRAMRALERHHDPEEGDGWALRLDGLPERVAVSRRLLPAVREALAAF
jgi:two-component system, LytTR family, response regulator AlgR